jgi:hypothetical protein
MMIKYDDNGCLLPIEIISGNCHIHSARKGGQKMNHAIKSSKHVFLSASAFIEMNS